MPEKRKKKSEKKYPASGYVDYTDSGLIVEQMKCKAVYPFTGQTSLLFQRRGLQLGEFSKSPIGLLIHLSFGLWDVYRTALCVSQNIAEKSEIIRQCEDF